jgi:hypothetical protein
MYSTLHYDQPNTRTKFIKCQLTASAAYFRVSDKGREHCRITTDTKKAEKLKGKLPHCQSLCHIFHVNFLGTKTATPTYNTI